MNKRTVFGTNFVYTFNFLRYRSMSPYLPYFDWNSIMNGMLKKWF